MTYIGLSPPNTFTKSTSQTFTGNGSTTAFTLQTRVSSPEDLEVFVSNVQQQPTESYTIGSDGVTMTFSEAPPSGTFYVIYRTVAQQAGTDTGASRLGENNTFTGTQTFNADVSFPDNVKAKFGTGNDFEIFHDGSNSIISETGTGGLRLKTNNFGTIEFNNAEGSVLARFIGRGNNQFFHSNSTKLETTSTGVAVTGNVDMNGGELILDADADTSITADTDDQIDFKVGGTDTVSVVADALKIRSDTATLHFRRATNETDIARIQYVNANPSFDIGADGKNIRFTNAGSFAETMRVQSNGLVGIGTTPADKLHIKGGQIQIESLAGDGAYLRIDNDANSGGKIWRAGVGVYAHPTFSIYNQTDNTFPCNIDTTNGGSVIRTFTSINLADDASALQIAEGFQGMVIVSNTSNGLTGIFRIENQNVPQLISGNSSWATSDVDGKLCLIKSATTNNVFFRNRFGATYGFRIMSIGAYQ